MEENLKALKEINPLNTVEFENGKYVITDEDEDEFEFKSFQDAKDFQYGTLD